MKPNFVFFAFQRYSQLKQQFDLKSREAELVQERLKQSTHHHKIEEVKSLEKEIGKKHTYLLFENSR